MVNFKTCFKLFAPALVAGAFIFCGFSVRLPKNVVVNGQNLSRLTASQAVDRLRFSEVQTLCSKRLCIKVDGEAYEYSYPEVNFVDNFPLEISGVKRSGNYLFSTTRYLNGCEQIVDYISKRTDVGVVEPYCVFNREGEPFTYYDGRSGYACDRQKLAQDISNSINGNFATVYPTVKKIAPQGSLNALKQNTKLLKSFTTYFDGSNTQRAANIRLAADMLNGSVIAAGKEFSFNATVGERTPERGFKQAKIIQNGKFVQGYGGGVCQVSTTLYNAAALSGLEICECHPHSLKVSYVPPSRDAMVSGNFCDLRFKNNRLTPIYLRVNCTFNSITCTFYGQSDGYDYSFDSTVLQTLKKPQPIILQGDGVVSYGCDGMISTATLFKNANGKSEVVFVRRDKYAAVADVIGEVGE